MVARQRGTSFGASTAASNRCVQLLRGHCCDQAVTRIQGCTATVKVVWHPAAITAAMSISHYDDERVNDGSLLNSLLESTDDGDALFAYLPTVDHADTAVFRLRAIII